MIIRILFFGLSFFLLEVCVPLAAEPSALLLGVDNAGSNHFRKAKLPGTVQAIKELGANFVVYHFWPVTNKGDQNSEATARRLSTIDDVMRRNGLKYTINNEIPNFVAALEIDPGKNEFAHPDGTHRWDIRMDWLRPLLPPDKTGQPALVGITYDECAHMQLTSHQFVKPLPGQDFFDTPFLANTDEMKLDDAFNLLVAKCTQLREKHYQDRVRLQTEQVWPDLFHVFARAGWTITPKILKENLSSVVMATSLGAALEYEDTNAEWWVSPDLWCKGYYPGHSPAALRSALMMGYWLGADSLYVENLDYQGAGVRRHPLASPTGSLISWKEDDTYELTAYGQVVRDFYKKYVPQHPRKHSWRDYKPRVAIVRLPDGAWGQRGSTFRDRLLGNKAHPMDDISAEWLHVWPILTHGVARPGAISINNGHVYPEYPWPFFVPIDSVAVFDHLVTGPVLESIECFIVCGHLVSYETFAEIAKRVQAGATCIISRRLYDAHPLEGGDAQEETKGKWVIVDSFTEPAVAAALKPYLGPANVARFRFEDFTMEFRPGVDKDTVNWTMVEEP